MLELILADQPPRDWHLLVKNGNFTFLLLELILVDQLADLTPIDHRSVEHHYTKSVSHIEECTYTHGRCTPQLTTDLWNTITPNQCHIQKNAHLPMVDVPPIEHRSLETPLHRISFTYRRMCIYPWQMYPLIDHRSPEHHYTKSVSHIEECTYTHGRQTP